MQVRNYLKNITTKWQGLTQRLIALRDSPLIKPSYIVMILLLPFIFVSAVSGILVDGYCQWSDLLPFSVIGLLHEGYILEVTLGLMIMSITAIIILMYQRRGLYRWGAYQLLCVTFAMLMMVWGATAIFLIVYHQEVQIAPWQLLQLYRSLQIYPLLQQQLVHYQLISIIITLVTALCYYTYVYLPKKHLLGNAHFANVFEILQAQFFSQQGIIVGEKYGQALKSTGYEHVLVFAPAGSGKTTAIAIPNLLTWTDSCVVNDPKIELFHLTSGYREQTLGHEVFLWAPTKEKTHRYNPLAFITKDKLRRIGEIQLICHTIIPDGKNDPIWYRSARELFLALILYVLDTKHQQATLPEIYALSKQYQFNGWLKELVETTDHLDPEFYRNAGSYLDTAEKMRASILKTFTGYLEIFANPIINAACSASDFDLRDLRKKKMTIYIGFTENEKEMISPLLTIFWQQLISAMSEKIPDEKEEPYDLLCLMEEFSILGRLVNLKSSLKILRGYRVRVLIIIQYLAQVLEYYSKAEAEAFKNIKTKVSFALDSHEDAQYVSQLLGMQTKKITNRSYTSHSTSGSSSKSIQLQSLPLMRPEEIQRLKKYKCLIMRTGYQPIKAKQHRWYKIKELRSLVRTATAIPEQKPRILPFIKNEVTSNQDKKSAINEHKTEKRSMVSVFNEIGKSSL